MEGRRIEFLLVCILLFAAQLPLAQIGELMKFLLPLFAVSVLLSPVKPAHAAYALLASASQWQVADDIDPFLQAPACRAFTRAGTSVEPVEFSLSYPKDGKLLPMIALRTRLAPPMVAIKTSSKEVEYLFLLQPAATNQDENLYWYAPLNFAHLESLVRERNTLDLLLDPKGAITPVQVSLKGSANALDATKKCLKAVRAPTDFFKLLNGKKETFQADLGDRSPSFLFQAVQNAFDAYNAGVLLNGDLSKLRKANAPLLSKEAAALAVLKKASTEFTSAKTKLDTANQLVFDLTQKLTDAKTTLEALQVEKPKAEADLAAKKAVYLPLKEKMAPYEKNVDAAERALSEVTDQIADDEQTISRNTRLIPQLESERSSLVNQLPGLQRRARDYSDEFDTADRNYRNYDVRRETENILSRDANYTWAQRDLESGRRELNEAQTHLARAQDALRQCRSAPNPNCGGHESEVNIAESEISRARSKISGAEWQIQNAESRASSEANSESDRLRRIRDDASSNYDSARNELRNAQDRIDEIRSSIPRLRKQIADAEAELPGLRAQVAPLQSALNARISERDQFSRSIGFGQAELAYRNASAHLNEVNSGIAQKTKEIPRITKDLAAAQKTIDPLTKKFVKAQSQLAAAEAKLAPIEEQLKPFHDQEKVLLTALATESEKFKNNNATYQELYLELGRELRGRVRALPGLRQRCRGPFYLQTFYPVSFRSV
jgi:predicted  nucleic acid-binding Zn-ribbon protein